MTDEEEVALKAACVQAAATLISVVPGTQQIDHQIKECAKRARELFEEITGLPWMRRS